MTYILKRAKVATVTLTGKHPTYGDDKDNNNDGDKSQFNIVQVHFIKLAKNIQLQHKGRIHVCWWHILAEPSRLILLFFGKKTHKIETN